MTPEINLHFATSFRERHKARIACTDAPTATGVITTADLQMAGPRSR